MWNLSLGTKEECELDEFSEFGMALDNIQDENNVLIVKSAGNCANFMKGLPKVELANPVIQFGHWLLVLSQEKKNYTIMRNRIHHLHLRELVQDQQTL